MIPTLPEFSDPVDAWLSDRKAAALRQIRRTEYRVTSTAFLGSSPALDAHYANPLADVPETPTIDEMMRQFEALLKTPLLPARVPVTPTVTKLLPLFATPTQSTITRKQAGPVGILVSFDGMSVQAGETTLAEAIAAVAPRPQWATINGYQGARWIKAIECVSDTVYYAFQLIADRPDVWTWFKAADCVVVEMAVRRVA